VSGHRDAVVTGRCLCGAIGYELRGTPRDTAHCHCPSCRRASGAPVVTWTTYPRDAFRVTRGQPAAVHSSPPVTRTFCASCGTPLTYWTSDEPAWIDVTVCSLDDPDAMPPQYHIWTQHRVAWFDTADTLERRPRGSTS
jgi:hypothetical protein